MVSPDGSRIHSFHPGSQSARVRATGEDPWDVLGIAVRVTGERQANCVGEVCQVVDGVFQGQVLKIFSRQLCEGRRSAPVSVLQDDRGCSNLLGDDSSGAVGAEIAGVAGSIDFAGGEENDWRACRRLSAAAACIAILARLTRPLPECGVVVVELLKRAQIRVAVVNVLLERGVAHATDMLPISAWQMAHGAPSVHLVAVASRHCHRADQRGQKDFPHGSIDNRQVPGCVRLVIITPCREKAGSLGEIALAVGRVVQVPRQQSQTPWRLPPSLISVKQSRNVTLPPLSYMSTTAVCLQGVWSRVG